MSPKQFQIGQGLVGQCAQEKERILVTNVPGDYVKINSSLGDALRSASWCCRCCSKVT